MVKDRYLHKTILGDLKKKMVFLGGPRQVGKTTLAQYIGYKDYKKYTYLNWDNRQDKKTIIQGRYEADSQLVIFDEIHKYRDWKNYIKGEFDKYKERFHILVTGSARLNLCQRGGDSLMGRYYYYRLHPFSLSEILGREVKLKVFKELVLPETDEHTDKIYKQLFEFGGFPEPFLKANQRVLRRFHNERIERLIKEDIRDVELVRQLSLLEILVEILPEKVGSLLSLNALRQDLNVAHKTITLWMDILEKFYYHFRIYPFRSNVIKSLRKEPKMYLWDWSQVPDKSNRLENIVASHLLKTIHFFQDAQGYKAELNFLRDIEGKEVDFLVTVDKKPWFAVEVKSSDKKVAKSLLYFANKLRIPFVYQVVDKKGVDFLQDNVRIVSVDKFLQGLL